MSLRPRPAIRPTVSPRPTMRASRPPAEFVRLLSFTGPELHAAVREIESSPLFARLVKSDIVRRLTVQGRIPRARYEDYMDRAYARFLNEHRIAERDGWEKDWLNPGALRRVKSIAARYEVPVSQVERFIRYWNSREQEDRSFLESLDADPGGSDTGETIPGESSVDLTDLLELARQFVERYQVSEEEFTRLILSGEAAVSDLTDRFNCSEAEAREMLEAADRLLVIDYAEAGGSVSATRSERVPSERSNVIAAVSIRADGQLAVEVSDESLYASRYLIRGSTRTLSPDQRALIDRLRQLNRCASATSRMLHLLAREQIDFLRSGRDIELRPLSQADVARKLGESRSTISRLIHGKSVTTDRGELPLSFFLASKAEVIRRLTAENPQWSDEKLRQHLADRYGCRIARRTVAYHRRRNS